jgi:Protein of unknown function (DUF3775)
MKLSEATERVITLARRVREYYDAELPNWYPDYPIIGQAQEGPPPPKEERELRNSLRSLPSETIYRLTLLMYLGRGDFGADDLPSSYEALRQTFGESEWAASQMIEKVPLAEYLSDGLLELKRHRIPVDDLPLEDTQGARA